LVSALTLSLVGGPTGQPSLDRERTSYAAAFDEAAAAGDVTAMANAALGLASLQRFGEEAGRAPAALHRAYVAAADIPSLRARLAAGLARSWVYCYDPARARPFADEAAQLAASGDDPALLADALNAQLATRWGPDDLSDRLHITARLQDVAAHVDAAQTRLDAHLWRLTTALETLDVIGVQRQLSALDMLAAETGLDVVAFFAASRRAMHAVLTGDLDRAGELLAIADAHADAGQVPDGFAIHHTLLVEIARQRDDIATIREEVPLFEGYAIERGIQSLLAEAAVLWSEAGDVDRAAELVAQIAGAGLDNVPRDVDFLLTMTQTLEAATAANLVDVCRDGVELLVPYAGRAVVNAGAVTCRGVVEDYLSRAGAAIGDPRADDWRIAAASSYRRLDAPWWLQRVTVQRQTSRAAPPRPTQLTFRPVPGRAVWSVGPVGAQKLLPDMKGLHYLRCLVQQPGVEITALELSSIVGGAAVVVEQPSVEVGGDRRAMAAYRARLREIDDELEEATSWADSARMSRLEDEREALLQEVGAATGLSGRQRTRGASAERARVAVRKAIAAALDRIEAEDAATARLLRTTVRTGTTCCYEADPLAPVTWQLDCFLSRLSGWMKIPSSLTVLRGSTRPTSRGSPSESPSWSVTAEVASFMVMS
jgi:hypothetical protein